jgi:hypothetical protein
MSAKASSKTKRPRRAPSEAEARLGGQPETDADARPAGVKSAAAPARGKRRKSSGSQRT